MAEANNALRIRFHGFSLLQTEDNAVLSDYNDPGDTLDYPTLTNEQANYISVEIKKRLTGAITGLIEELAAVKVEQSGGAKSKG